MTRPLQVFLCHASQDKPEVWKLHRYLKTRGVKPWLDQADLLPGEDWEVEIPKALYASDVILVCLSKNSVNKEGYVQKEIAFALDKALEKPEGTIFIIPVKLEDCELPKRLARYQAVDLYRTDGRKRLLMGLNKRIANLGEEVLPIKIEETKQKTPRPIKSETNQEEKFVKPKLQKPEESIVEEKKESAKPFTRILNPASLNSKKKSEPKESKQNYNFSRLGIGGIILISILGILLAGNYFLNNLPATETPEITPTEVAPTEITVTSTFAPIATATKLLAISTTTRFTIGSTTLGNDGMTLMYVPAGEFTMGSDEGNANEQPAHQVYLDTFWIDQTEVTNAMYAQCVDANQCNPPKNISSKTRSPYFWDSGFNNYPVIYVSWHDAIDYCTFAGRRLPTEAEWEKAARGTNASIYPWGNTDPKNNLLNFNDNAGDTTAVGSYPEGASIYGALDMSGNVWEWVNSIYQPYPYNENDGRENLNSLNLTVVSRGGAFFNEPPWVRSTHRSYPSPGDSTEWFGFRCAMDADQ